MNTRCFYVFTVLFAFLTSVNSQYRMPTPHDINSLDSRFVFNLHDLEFYFSLELASYLKDNSEELILGMSSSLFTNSGVQEYRVDMHVCVRGANVLCKG
jgi:hypothetical protein